MLGKLLKYDLKWIFKIVVVFYIAAIILAGISRVCINTQNSVLFDIVGKFTSGMAIGLGIGCLINCVIRSWVRFIGTVYKDESYLTHTLPVEKKTIYLSKVVCSIICALVSVAIILLVLFICFGTESNIEFLKQSLEIVVDIYDTTMFKLLFVIALVLFLEVVCAILCGYVGIIIGYSANKAKLAKSIVCGFCFYALIEIFLLVFILILGLFNSNIMNIINTTEMVNFETIKLLMIIALFTFLGGAIVYYFIGKKKLEKGVNVE